jgi:hypothetical protein
MALASDSNKPDEQHGDPERWARVADVVSRLGGHAPARASRSWSREAMSSFW